MPATACTLPFGQRRGSATPRGIGEVAPADRLVRHRNVARPSRAVARRRSRRDEAHDRVDVVEARGRLAQRSGRQQQPVAESARRIDDRDLDVAREPVVLQAVVAQHDVARRMRCEQAARRGDAVAADPHRDSRRRRAAAARRRRRRGSSLDAHLARALLACRRGRGSRCRACGPARASASRQRDDQRRLARAAHGDVADDDDRHADARAPQHAAPIERAPCATADAEQPATAAAARQPAP